MISQNILERITVAPTASIRDVAQIIQDSQVKIVLVCDPDKVLLGTVTDGDIRRAVLRSADLSGSVDAIMNRTPRVARQGETTRGLRALMRNAVIRHLPRIDENNRVTDLVLLDEVEEVTPQRSAVMLMAGGRGQRLMPLTEDTPKPLLKVGRKPVLERQIDHLIDHGFSRFYLSVNYLADKIEKYFGDGSRFGVEIHYVRESKPLGTAGALSLLEPQEAPLLVINGDIITKTDFATMVTYFEDEGVAATMGVREFLYTVPFGCVKTTGNRIAALEEKPTFRHLINAGIYVIAPEVVRRVPADTPLDMPQLFDELIATGHDTNTFHITEEWIDIGHKEDLIWARKIFEVDDRHD